MRTKAPRPIVLAMDSQMACTAYGPFIDEREATLWVQTQDELHRDLSFTVIALVPARVTASPARPARR